MSISPHLGQQMSNFETEALQHAALDHSTSVSDFAQDPAKLARNLVIRRDSGSSRTKAKSLRRDGD